MGCSYCGYSVGHASWCRGIKGSAVNTPATTVDMAARDEYVEQLCRDKAKLIQDLAAERKRIAGYQKECDRYKDALKQLLDMQLVETLPIIEDVLQPEKEGAK